MFTPHVFSRPSQVRDFLENEDASVLESGEWSWGVMLSFSCQVGGDQNQNHLEGGGFTRLPWNEQRVKTPDKWLVGRRSFPFGTAYFQGWTVSFRECMFVFLHVCFLMLAVFLSWFCWWWICMIYVNSMMVDLHCIFLMVQRFMSWMIFMMDIHDLFQILPGWSAGRKIFKLIIF